MAKETKKPKKRREKRHLHLLCWSTFLSHWKSIGSERLMCEEAIVVILCIIMICLHVIFFVKWANLSCSYGWMEVACSIE
jgi:hypothetical protein